MNLSDLDSHQTACACLQSGLLVTRVPGGFLYHHNRGGGVFIAASHEHKTFEVSLPAGESAPEFLTVPDEPQASRRRGKRGKAGETQS